MKKIIIFICFLYTSLVSAGAPAPQDKSSLPKTPHTFNNLTNLSIGVEWDEAFINKYIFNSNAYKLIKPITGGISIIKAKKHNDFSKFSGSYFWVDVMGLDSNNIERLVVSGVYGPGDLITDVMKLIYNLNVYNGSNKLTLINDKALVRTNIRKKNVLNIVLEKSNKCNELSNKFKVFSISSNNKISKSTFEWNSKKVCEANPKSVLFNGIFKDYKIKKLLWANIAENQNFTITKNKE